MVEVGTESVMTAPETSARGLHPGVEKKGLEVGVADEPGEGSSP